MSVMAKHLKALLQTAQPETVEFYHDRRAELADDEEAAAEFDRQMLHELRRAPHVEAMEPERRDSGARKRVEGMQVK